MPQRGFRHSDETRAKMSAARKGGTPMLGKSHSEATKAKMAAAHTGRRRSAAHRAAISARQHGRVQSAETRAKISMTKRARYAELSPEEREERAIAHTSKLLPSIRRRGSSFEAEMEAFLYVAGIAYRAQEQIGRYVVDFLIPDRGLIVECDGHHHRMPKIQQHDERRDAALTDRGYTVLRVTENQPADAVLALLRCS